MVVFANLQWRDYHVCCHPKYGCVKRETLISRFSHGTQRHSDHFGLLREMQSPAVQIPQRRARSVGEVRCRSHRRRPYPRRYALPKMRTGICAVQNVRRPSRAQDHPRQSVHEGNGMNECTKYPFDFYFSVSCLPSGRNEEQTFRRDHALLVSSVWACLHVCCL